MSYLLDYGYRVEAQVEIPLPEVSYTPGYTGALDWRGTGVVLYEGDEAVLEVKGTVEVRLHPELVATACTEMVAPLERPNECHYGSDAVLRTVGPDYYRDGWAAPVFRVAGKQLPLNFPFRGPGQIEMMRYGTWFPYQNRGFLLPYHRYTGSQTVNIYIRRKQQPELTVTCTNPVTRGEQIICTAGKKRPETPGELRITGWSFEGGGSSIKAEGNDQNSSTWGGVMVVSGAIRVDGTIGGRPALPGSMSVDVRGRTWTAQTVYPDAKSAYVGEPELRYPPVTPAISELEDGVFGKYLDAPPIIALAEGSGPNRGWVYVDKPPVFSLTPLIYLSIALSPQDPFYRAQRGESGIRFSGRPPCGPDFMRQAARHVPAHEEGHHRVAKSFYESTAVTEQLEQRIVFDPDGTMSTTEVAADFITPLRMQLKSLQDSHDRSDILAVPCSFTPISH
jgi:hypothetical protein